MLFRSISRATTTNSSSLYNATNLLTIGSESSSIIQYFNGFISNLRVLKGTALYTANFTPPVNELQPIQDTVLLCCNNPDSAGAVSLAGIGTSKTITVNGNAAAVGLGTSSPGLTRDITFGTQYNGVTKFDTLGYFTIPSGTTEQRFPNFAGEPAASARGIFGGGIAYPATTRYDTIDYVTISSAGNATSFGTLLAANQYCGACASEVRGVFGGGYVVPAQIGRAHV